MTKETAPDFEALDRLVAASAEYSNLVKPLIDRLKKGELSSADFRREVGAIAKRLDLPGQARRAVAISKALQEPPTRA